MEVLHLGFLQLIDQDELFSFHWKCDTAKIFQLGFADDLLLFCRADMDSIRIFKTGLDRFAKWSGLRLNVQKSQLIISRSAQGLREEMLAALEFQEGVLPLRHLGLPLLSSRLTIADCRSLLLKIDKGIAGWEGMTISDAAGEWHWPPITDFECLEITHNLPVIFGGEDRVVWRFDGGQPTT
ncbi:UNVERIFIED_CONTAM: hypothetical protein Sindi_0091400 [Sesamum indicum]